MAFRVIPIILTTTHIIRFSPIILVILQQLPLLRPIMPLEGPYRDRHLNSGMLATFLQSLQPNFIISRICIINSISLQPFTGKPKTPYKDKISC
jgi:hypothetical protein